MALATSYLTLEAVAAALSEAENLETCCLSYNIVANGLQAAYCPGADAFARLGNVIADKKLEYFKGYNPDLSNSGTALYIPDGFSPDGDGVHDLYIIWGLASYPGNNMLIIDVDNGNEVVLNKDNYHLNWWNGKKDNTGALVAVGYYRWYLTLPGSNNDRDGWVFVSY